MSTVVVPITEAAMSGSAVRAPEHVGAEVTSPRPGPGRRLRRALRSRGRQLPRVHGGLEIMTGRGSSTSGSPGATGPRVRACRCSTVRREPASTWLWDGEWPGIYSLAAGRRRSGTWAGTPSRSSCGSVLFMGRRPEVHFVHCMPRASSGDLPPADGAMGVRHRLVTTTTTAPGSSPAVENRPAVGRPVPLRGPARPACTCWRTG